MKYELIRNDIQTGDVFFTHDNSLLSRLIRFVTSVVKWKRAKTSHTGTFVVENNRVLIRESIQWFGVRMVPATDRLAKNGFILVKTGNKIALDKAWKGVGIIKYDWLGALAVPFFKTENSKNFCTEDVVKLHDIELDRLFPEDLLEYFIKNGKEIYNIKK